MNEEEEWEQIQKNIDAMRHAPVVMNALINILLDKGITTRKELLQYIKSNKGFNSE